VAENLVAKPRWPAELLPVIRRDYILRLVEQFIQALSRIDSLKGDQLWREAAGVVDEEFQRFLGTGAATAAQLSETELLARLIKGEPTQAVREKTLMLAALFKEAGDLAIAQNRPEDGCAILIKGLDLLLDVLAGDEPLECPDFVPGVEVFVVALHDTPIPLQTQARLMQHYERIGEFAKAEDWLFAMIDAEPGNPGLVNFGMVFYERLRGQSDASLLAGNLPRPEVEAGLLELRSRSADSQSRA
jgi:hypothetical protein